MSCCKGTPKETFLIQKGKNFREYILKYSPEKDVLEYMEKFNEENLLVSITNLLIPIKLSGASDFVVGELMSRLNIPAQETDEVKQKIIRYFNMFADVALSTD
jgi:hypothetical protein